MRSAKAALAFLYLHLVAGTAAPVALLYRARRGWDALNIGILLSFLLAACAAQLAGWVCVGMAAKARRERDLDALRHGWRLLKLGAVPFYALNFIVGGFVWFSIVAASRGIFFFLLPIPFGYTWLLIAQSGCIGLWWLRLMRQMGENPSRMHDLLQFIPVLDIVSTVSLLRRYPAPDLRAEN